VTVTGEVDYRAMAKKAEAELKELAKEESARAALSFDQAVAHSHDIERINLVRSPLPSMCLMCSSPCPRTHCGFRASLVGG
jgi:hypothetical protein